MDSNLGKRIKTARKAKGLTQVKLAELLSIAESTLNKYEKGHRTPDSALLGQMARILKCDPAWLLTGKGDIFPDQQAPAHDYHTSADPFSRSIVAEKTTPFTIEDEAMHYARLAFQILKSDTGYAGALKENILWFHEAVKDKAKVRELEERVKLLEQRLPKTDSEG